MSLNRLLISMALLLAVTGCGPKHVKPDLEKDRISRIELIPSQYLSRVIDKRPEIEKRTRSRLIGKETVQYIGDEAFSRSPLNAIATRNAYWLNKHPNSVIEIDSLVIHFGDRLEAVAAGYKTFPGYVGGFVDTMLVNVIYNAMQTDHRPEGNAVVIRLEAKANGKRYSIRHVQQPIRHRSPLEWVAAALDDAAYKLRQQLSASSN